MNKKYLLCGLSALSTTLALNNVDNSNAFNEEDSFVNVEYKNDFKYNKNSKTGSNIISIEDENLLKVINNQLGRGEVLDTVTKEDLESLNELVASNKGISSIKGLEYAVNLRKLSLTHNKITSVAGISKLTELTTLDLGGNSLTSLGEIAELTNLTSLSLGANKITDITGVKNLTNLTNLSFGSNQIEDISEIANLTKLTNLSLHSNKILDVSPIKDLKNITSLRVDRQKPIINLNNMATEQGMLDISIKNPIIGQVKDNMSISDVSNEGIYEDDTLKWTGLTLGNHSLTFYFSETVTVGTSSVGFYGTTTINLKIQNKPNNQVDEKIEESEHVVEFNDENFEIYTTITSRSLSVTTDYIIHKGVRCQLPYKLKYDIYDESNNIIEVYDILGNKASYQIKIDEDNTSSIEEAIDYLLTKDKISVDEISYIRTLINSLNESAKKDSLQARLDSMMPTSEILNRINASANLDIYVECDNMLSISLNTNSITFENFSGTEDMVRENAVNVGVNSSLPYALNVYLPNEISNSDKSEFMDLSILKIKEHSESTYQSFSNINDKIVLKDNNPKGSYKNHGIDLKLSTNSSHKPDYYRAVIRFEVEQK